jgi:anti-sigma regulatory factor (Ser/Thr protein kinase)
MNPPRIEESGVRGHYPRVHAPPARPRDQRGHDAPGRAERGRAGQDHPCPAPAIQACRTAHFIFPATPQAARLARRATRRVLASWQLAALREPAELIVSELVANAIRHARTGGNKVGLQLEADGTWMRIEVHDSDPRPPQPRTPAALDESGLGLTIIEATAGRWGVRKTGEGKAVWADLHTDLGHAHALPGDERPPTTRVGLIPVYAFRGGARHGAADPSSCRTLPACSGHLACRCCGPGVVSW